MSDRVNLRVYDGTGEKIVSELKKQNRRLGGVLFFNIVFIGLLAYDIIKTKQLLNDDEEEDN